MGEHEMAEHEHDGRNVLDPSAPDGKVLSQAQVARLSGPVITAVVTAMLLAFSLSVTWVDATTTAAGFWPPAGVSLVAFLVVPVRRWGWVVAAIFDSPCRAEVGPRWRCSHCWSCPT